MFAFPIISQYWNEHNQLLPHLLALKAPGHQNPQRWLNIHCIGLVSYKDIAHKVNSIR